MRTTGACLGFHVAPKVSRGKLLTVAAVELLYLISSLK